MAIKSILFTGVKKHDSIVGAVKLISSIFNKNLRESKSIYDDIKNGMTISIPIKEDTLINFSEINEYFNYVVDSEPKNENESVTLLKETAFKLIEENDFNSARTIIDILNYKVYK